jgi:hypothetical protein
MVGMREECERGADDSNPAVAGPNRDEAVRRPPVAARCPAVEVHIP